MKEFEGRLAGCSFHFTGEECSTIRRPSVPMKEAQLSVTAGVAILGLLLRGIALAESPYQSSADFSKYAEKLRESAIAAP